MPLDHKASRAAAEDAVERLRSTLGKLEVALGATRDAIAWTDSRGVIEWSNAPFDRLAQKPHHGVVGASILEVLPLDQWAIRRRQHPAKAVLSAKSFRRQVLEIQRDGRRQFLEFFGSWAEGGGIGPIAVFVVRDVTTRVQREDALKKATAILRAQQEASLDGIVITGPDGEVLTANRRFSEMWPAHEKLGDETFEERVTRIVTERLKNPEAVTRRVMAIVDDRSLRANDELEFLDGRVYERYTAPILGEDGEYYGRAWYFRDVTARKASEQALAAKTRELARSNAELQQFASSASHDLMEPLRKITAFGDILRRSAASALDAQSLGFLERMQGAAARMGRLIEDLLQYSRVYGDARAFEYVDLERVAQEVSGDLERVVRDSAARVSIGALPSVWAHPFQMRQLFQNLIANALKFQRPGVVPEIGVEALAGRPGFVEIAVRDNGIGFDDKCAEKLFQPFLRLHTREEYEGTGLGLAICRRICTRHGGWIAARGEPGKGSVFTVTLPRRSGP